MLIVSTLSFTVFAAENYTTRIRHAKVELRGNQYELTADLTYQLSPAAKEALLNGIALSWKIPVIFKQQRDYLWNKTILRITLGYQIQYFALLNVYRVTAESSGQVTNFSSLAAALHAMSRISALKLIDKAQLAAEQTYRVELKVAFDREALPIPLRPMAYFDRQWFLSSEWVVCKV